MGVGWCVFEDVALRFGGERLLCRLGVFVRLFCFICFGFYSLFLGIVVVFRVFCLL